MSDRGSAASESGSPIGVALRLLAPYFAVLVFWCIFHSAWLAILAYHVQILFWLCRAPRALGSLTPSRLMLLALPSAIAGPVVYFLLPLVTGINLHSWLAGYGLSGASFALMVLYFGLVHPPLEQLHWALLRQRTPLAHLMFAGYHVIVLYSLLPVPWLAATFAVLATASFMWQEMGRRTGGLLEPVASHALADFGIVIAAYLLA